MNNRPRGTATDEYHRSHHNDRTPFQASDKGERKTETNGHHRSHHVNRTQSHPNAKDDISTGSEVNDQQEFIFHCDEINKRSIGKAQLQFCGNEGTVDSPNKATLRRLLQALISHIDKEHPDTWKNAEVKIYDDDFDVYSIQSGDRRALFLATFDGFGNPQVVRTERSKLEERHAGNGNCLIM